MKYSKGQLASICTLNLKVANIDPSEATLGSDRPWGLNSDSAETISEPHIPQ